MIWGYRHYAVEKSLLCPAGKVARPEAKLRIRGDKADAYVRALVDSGADHCLFPYSLATDIGAELYEDQLDSAKGFSGDEVTVVPGRVSLALLHGEEVFEWRAMVGFARFASKSSECIILGRLGGLEFFRVILDEGSQTVSLEALASISGEGE